MNSPENYPENIFKKSEATKKSCSERFRKYHRKTLALGTCNFIKKRHWCFSVKFAKFLRTPSLKNSCKRLLL